MSLKKLKEMFENMVLKKNVSLIPTYYHEDLLLYTNGKVIDYKEFFDSHQKYYAEPKKYSVKYDDETCLEQGSKLAYRMWITVKEPEKKTKEMEVILIVLYKDGKIYRLWELTYPDWSILPEFQDKN